MEQAERYEDVLRELMHAKGVKTQAELAKRMGATQQNVSMHLRGVTNRQTFPARFAEAMGLTDAEMARLANAYVYGRAAAAEIEEAC